MQEDKGQREDQPEQPQRGKTATHEEGHGVKMAPRLSSTQGAVLWRALFGCVLATSCVVQRDSDVVVFASGADLESANPLVTIHPLARQVQRHALFVTLTRLDS